MPQKRLAAMGAELIIRQISIALRMKECDLITAMLRIQFVRQVVRQF